MVAPIQHDRRQMIPLTPFKCQPNNCTGSTYGSISGHDTWHADNVANDWHTLAAVH